MGVREIASFISGAAAATMILTMMLYQQLPPRPLPLGSPLRGWQLPQQPQRRVQLLLQLLPPHLNQKNGGPKGQQRKRAPPLRLMMVLPPRVLRLLLLPQLQAAERRRGRRRARGSIRASSLP